MVSFLFEKTLVQHKGRPIPAPVFLSKTLIFAQNSDLWLILKSPHYLIIDQYEPLVAVYSRKKVGEKWEYETFSDPNDEIPLDFFKTKLPLRSIYKKVNFGEPKADRIHTEARPV